jgi:hypothetical protein
MCDAYERGYKAYELYSPLCPYDKGTEEWLEYRRLDVRQIPYAEGTDEWGRWVDGWIDARLKEGRG